MPTRSSFKRYWYAVAIVVVSLCVVIPLWKSGISAKPSRVEPSFGTTPKVELFPKNSSSELARVPVLLPGDTCEKAEGALGKPMEEDEYSRTWKKQDFMITATTDSACHLTGISIAVIKGHKALTVDGVTLGATTLADAEKILKKPLIEPSESVEAAEGHWSATLQLGPVPGMPFKTAYSAYSDEADAMHHDPTMSDFRDLPITQYNLAVVDPHTQSK